MKIIEFQLILTQNCLKIWIEFDKINKLLIKMSTLIFQKKMSILVRVLVVEPTIQNSDLV
jgi:hypothetical protein